MSADEHPIEPRRPEVIAPQPLPQNPLQQAVNAIMSMFGTSVRSSPRGERYDDLGEPEKRIVDAMMEKMQPELESKAKAMLEAEIRDRIVRYGDFVELEKMLKKGKTPSIKRKHGCIYLQFGTGDANDPIDEFLVATT